MRIALRLLALAAVVLAPVAGAQKVTIGTVSPITVAHSPLFIAKELGYFREEGLDFEVIEFNGTGVLIPQMLARRVTIGFPNPDPLIISRQPGKEPIPLKFFYNVLRTSVWEVAVPAESPVKTLKDLKGRKIGVGALTFGNIPITKAMFKELGFESGRDYELVPTGLGAPAYLALRQGKVDALNLFDLHHANMELQGTAIRRLQMPAKYTNLFSNGFVAHEELLRSDPTLLARFGRAFAKGTVACAAARGACFRVFWKHYPNQRPQGVDEAVAIGNTTKLLDGRFKVYLAFPPGQPRRFGEYQEKVWKDFVTALHDGGQLGSTDIPVAALYTNALVPEINRFDVGAVERAAKGLN